MNFRIRPFRGPLALEVAYLAWAFFAARLTIGCGESARDVGVHFALFGFCAWFTWTPPRWLRITEARGYHGGRELNLHLHWSGEVGGKSLSLRWRLWCEQHMWSSSTPKWRDFSLDLFDVLFGKSRYATTTLRKWSGPLLMPEGIYDADVEIFDSTWSRPRWPRFFDETVRRCTVDVPVGVDHDDKGPLFGLTCRCEDDVSMALAKFTANVVEDRTPGRKYQHRQARSAA